MLPKPESACFVIADISGYTSYLTAVELDHAQDIIADLMDTVVTGLRPPFHLAKFEGDAAFVYAVTDSVDGSMLQDAIESAYFGFRKRLRNIRQATICECNACRRMGDLDFKFVSHYGQFIKHTMAGQEELAGGDVILIHRLLKNDVNARLGGHAYALYSDACIEAMAIDPSAQGLIEHHETIDIIGEVKCWVRDLEDAWAQENDRQHNQVGREDAAAMLEFDIAAPRQAVWEHFTLPGRRPQWRASTGVSEISDSGRRGVGTIVHCVHGKDIVIEEILDWRPFDYLTLTTLLPIPDTPKILMTYVFTETPDGGTHIEIRAARPEPRDLAFFEQAGARFAEDITAEIATLRQMLEGKQGDGAIAEPALPTSAERFLTQPVHAH